MARARTGTAARTEPALRAGGGAAARGGLPDPDVLRATLTGAPPSEPGPEPGSEPAAQAAPDAAWARLRTLPLDPRVLARNRVVTAARSDPAHGAFDVLRTKIVLALRERGWRRIGVTSPTKACGKTFTAVNLALTLSRHAARRTVLLDLDLHFPAVARTLGASGTEAMGDFLRGASAPEAALRRATSPALMIGPHLAVGLCGRPEPFAAELFQSPEALAALGRLDADLAPDLTLMDLPPALAQDDVLAAAPLLDCVLLVVGGGQTTPREVREAARRLGDSTPILGLVLNRAEGEGVYDYSY
jgi:Mrp family chromosome partitioning ATPase